LTSMSGLGDKRLMEDQRLVMERAVLIGACLCLCNQTAENKHTAKARRGT